MKPVIAVRETVFWKQVDKTETCWLWTGHKQRGGYGRSCGRQAHRRSYELLVGPIPEGLELDHLCRNPSCVNPDHLEPVTNAENMRRRYADYTECIRGHAFTPENTINRPGGRRGCRECQRMHGRAYMAKRRARLRAERQAAA